MDDGGDLHEQILHAEAHIEELTDREMSEDHPYFKSRHCCRRNLDLGNNHRSGRVRSYDPDWVTCGGYWRDGRFWVKREHFEANYDRHESCRGIQKRVDRPNGSSDRPDVTQSEASDAADPSQPAAVEGHRPMTATCRRRARMQCGAVRPPQRIVWLGVVR